MSPSVATGAELRTAAAARDDFQLPTKKRGAPAGNRTRIPVCRQAESLKVNTGRTKQTIETADIWLRFVQFRPSLRRVLVKFSPSVIRVRTDGQIPIPQASAQGTFHNIRSPSVR
jgi:hypothetical protein